jgi:hypothetical protein
MHVARSHEEAGKRGLSSTVKLNPTVPATNTLPIPARLWHPFTCLLQRTPKKTVPAARHDLTDSE